VVAGLGPLDEVDGPPVELVGLLEAGTELPDECDEAGAVVVVTASEDDDGAVTVDVESVEGAWVVDSGAELDSDDGAAVEAATMVVVDVSEAELDSEDVTLPVEIGPPGCVDEPRGTVDVAELEGVVVDAPTGMITGVVPLVLVLVLPPALVVPALLAAADDSALLLAAEATEESRLLTPTGTELEDEEAVDSEDEPEEVPTGMTTGIVALALLVAADVDSLVSELDG